MALYRKKTKKLIYRVKTSLLTKLSHFYNPGPFPENTNLMLTGEKYILVNNGILKDSLCAIFSFIAL
jgi:hypothetical protein